MKQQQRPSPPLSPQVETFGGAYHRFDTDCRDGVQPSRPVKRTEQRTKAPKSPRKSKAQG